MPFLFPGLNEVNYGKFISPVEQTSYFKAFSKGASADLRHQTGSGVFAR